MTPETELEEQEQNDIADRLDEDIKRKAEEKARLEMEMRQLQEQFGIQDMNEMIQALNYEEQQKSDYKELVSTAREFFDIEEKDERLRFMGKTDFQRSDAEVVGGKGTAYIRLIRSDVYQLLKWDFCQNEDMTIEEFDDMVEANQEYAEYNEFLWERAAEMLRQYPIVIEDTSVGLMRGLVSRGRKGRYEYRDIISGQQQQQPGDITRKEELLKKIQKYVD